jgi:hypothetical protein
VGLEISITGGEESKRLEGSSVWMLKLPRIIGKVTVNQQQFTGQ